MPSLDLATYPLAALADQVGTPFFLYDGRELARRLAEVAALTAGDALQARYAMKANSNRKVLEAVRAAGLWVGGGSGQEGVRGGAVDRCGQRQRGAARAARGLRDGIASARGDVDRGRAARQRADGGAG